MSQNPIPAFLVTGVQGRGFTPDGQGVVGVSVGEQDLNLVLETREIRDLYLMMAGAVSQIVAQTPEKAAEAIGQVEVNAVTVHASPDGRNIVLAFEPIAGGRFNVGLSRRLLDDLRKALDEGFARRDGATP